MVSLVMMTDRKKFQQSQYEIAFVGNQFDVDSLEDGGDGSAVSNRLLAFFENGRIFQ